MDIKDYLERVGIAAPDDVVARAPSVEVLRQFHLAHVLSVPFENFDVAVTPREIALNEQKTFHKIVKERRGGFCYELNWLFAWGLRQLGFSEVVPYAAKVFRPGAGFTPESTHLTLGVTMDGQHYLADVGFGNAFAEPLRLEPGVEQHQQGHTYRLQRLPDEGDDAESPIYVVEEADAKDAKSWTTLYKFVASPASRETLETGLQIVQYSDTSPFRQGIVCSRCTPTGGRVTAATGLWSGFKPGAPYWFFERSSATDERKDTGITEEAEFYRVVCDHFGISLPSMS